MLMSSFSGAGTKRAVANQASSSRGAASGSRATAAAISSSLCARSRRQSVLSRVGTLRERLVIRAAFFAMGFPGRNEAASPAALGVDDDHYDVVNGAYCDDPPLAIVPAPVDSLQARPVEDALRSLEIDVMLAEVCPVRPSIPFELRHSSLLRFRSGFMVSSCWRHRKY